jgi:hypothetical protein
MRRRHDQGDAAAWRAHKLTREGLIGRISDPGYSCILVIESGSPRDIGKAPVFRFDGGRPTYHNVESGSLVIPTASGIVEHVGKG